MESIQVFISFLRCWSGGGSSGGTGLVSIDGINGRDSGMDELYTIEILDSKNAFESERLDEEDQLCLH